MHSNFQFCVGSVWSISLAITRAVQYHAMHVIPEFANIISKSHGSEHQKVAQTLEVLLKTVQIFAEKSQ